MRSRGASSGSSTEFNCNTRSSTAGVLEITYRKGFITKPIRQLRGTFFTLDLVSSPPTSSYNSYIRLDMQSVQHSELASCLYQ